MVEQYAYIDGHALFRDPFVELGLSSRKCV